MKRAAKENRAPPPLNETEREAKHRAIQEGLRAAAEGRVVPHAEVRRWLLSLGTDKELPRPLPKRKR